jgi:hypothetical protein
MIGRYVVLSAARPRSSWFGTVAQWANAGALPLELVKCVSADETVSRAASSRSFSAALLDAGMSGLDRDLIAKLRDHHIAVLVVEDPRIERDWASLGASAVLPTNFSQSQFLDALVDSAELVSAVSEVQAIDPLEASRFPPIRGSVIAVLGSGGTGSTTVAMALAEAFGQRSPTEHHTVLADFCLRAELAMLHDTQHISPGLQELADAHRLGRPDPAQIRDNCFEVKGRSYDLLIGLRRRRLWTTIRPAALAQALHGLAGAYSAVVLDTDDDFEGEAETGSNDVEDRNLLTRTAVQNADHVVVVGHASLKGLHGLCRVIAELREFGVDAPHIHPVLNFAPRSARVRAGYTKALADLLGTETRLFPPLFISFQPVDDRVRAVAPLPEGVVKPISALIERFTRTENPTEQTRFERITPGFLRRTTSAS